MDLYPQTLLKTPTRNINSKFLLSGIQYRSPYPKNFIPNTTQPSTGKQQPWLLKTLTTLELVNVAKKIFGYKPWQWQIDAIIKILEGHITFIPALTSAGKSLVLAMLAIAVELTESQGLVVMICPLKALQLDQVLLGCSPNTCFACEEVGWSSDLDMTCYRACYH